MRYAMLFIAMVALASTGPSALGAPVPFRAIDNEEGYAFGSGPRDLFHFPAGADQNLIIVEDTAQPTADNVLEIPGHDPATARVSVELGGELNIYWGDQRSGVIIQHEFLKIPGHQFGVQRIRFDNGVTWTKADLERRLGVARMKLAMSPAETGHVPSDLPQTRFASGHGTADQFHLLADDSSLYVFEIASGPHPNNEIILAPPYTSTAVDLFDDRGDAVLSWSGPHAERLTIVDALISRPGSHYGLQRIRFADGKVWTDADLFARLTHGSGAISGSTDADVLDTHGKTRYVTGRGGGDTIVYDMGYGALDIDEQDRGARPRNLLKFGAGIARSDVHTVRRGDDLDLLVGRDPNQAFDVITLKGEFSQSSGVIRGVQQVQFADGTRWDYAKLVELAGITSDYNPDPEGDAGPNIFRIIDSTRSVTGHGGGDSFELAADAGDVPIKEFDHLPHRPNRLILPDGVHKADVIPLRDGDDLYLEFRQQDQSSDWAPQRGVTLVGQYRPPPGVDAGVQQVVFADGSQWTADDLRRLASAQPLDHQHYDSQASADEAAQFRAADVARNDPALFRRFVAALRKGMADLGIDSATQDAILSATMMRASGEPCKNGETPPRWQSVGTLARWQAGLASLANHLQRDFVIPDAEPRAECDEGPCPPPTRSEIIEGTIAQLPNVVFPTMSTDGTAAPAAPMHQPSGLRGPIRIAATGDPKMDDAIRAALAQLGSGSGLSLDAESFPAPAEKANVLIFSLGPWENLPPPGRDFDAQMETWRSHRPWLTTGAPPGDNPLFVFVSDRVNHDPARIAAKLSRGQFDSDLFVGVDDNGAVLAAACHPDREAGSVIACLRSTAMVPGNAALAGDQRSASGCGQMGVVEGASIGFIARCAAAIAQLWRWLLGLLIGSSGRL